MNILPRARTFAALLGATLCAGQALALNAGDTVDNFRLNDQTGKSHELYYLSDMKAVVLMVQSNDCSVSDAAMPKLNRIRDDYQARGVAVLMLNSAQSRESVLKATQASTNVPILIDELRLIGESLNATQAGEVLVINPQGWKIAYRGPVDADGANYAKDAVDALLAGAPVKTSRTAMKGCAVTLPELGKRNAHAKISYAKTIAPMLEEKCVTCHRAGGIGPWQMTSYEMVRGFAPMIREVVRTQRMPPWHADPHYGVFNHDRSLSEEQAKALVHWIEAGAPRGEGADPLLSQQKDWPEWVGGQPDLIVEIPAFEVPAAGTIEYQNPIVKNTTGRDVWVSAVAFNPTERSVVHHILAYATRATGNVSGAAALRDTYLAGYVPGGDIVRFPPQTGVFVPQDMNFRFQVHYTAAGKKATDATKVGLYFMDAPPKYPLRQMVLLDPFLKIPANTKEHRIVAPPRTFDRDVLIYTLTAHSHYRGIASKYVARYPDGREEILLNVPKYDFNWQTAYELKEPKLLPKGTTLIYDTVYDNSSQNKANPDPNIEVRWGEQSWQEMIYGNVRYRFVDEEVGASTTAQSQEAPPF